MPSANRPFLLRPLIPGAIFVLTAAFVPAAAAPRGGGELQVHFLNVDQGNAAFILGPDGTRVLIDGGNLGKGLGVVRPYLLSIGVTDLDYTAITHWDLDHYAGVSEVVQNGFAPDVAAWDPGSAGAGQPSNGTVSGYLGAVAGVRTIPTVGDEIQLGDGAFLKLVALDGVTLNGTVDISGSAQLDNSASMGFLLRYGDFDCYIAGDLTSGGNGTSNVELPTAQWIGQVEVAMASHHGSNTSSASTVVAVLNPSFVVQSAGLDNPFFHPTKSTIDTWCSPTSCRPQWCTTAGDTDNGAGGFTVANGHIVVTTDGTTFRATRSSGAETLRFNTFENPGTTPSAGEVVVSELLVDPQSSSDLYGEWIELVNTVQAPRDLFGCRITSGPDTFTIRSRIVLGFGDRLVIGVDGRQTRNGNVFLGLGAPFEDFALSNGTSSVILRAPDNSILEQVSWGAGGVPITAGVSAERRDCLGGTGAANFGNAPSTWAGGDKGSPGDFNDLDLTSWPAFLAVPAPMVGGELRFDLASYAEAGLFYWVGLSQSATTGFIANGAQLAIDLDALLIQFLNVPQSLGLLGSEGTKTFAIPLSSSPGLVGFTGYTQMVTLQLTFPSFTLVPSKVSNLESFTIQ